MAIGASIYKVGINHSNLNSHYYTDFNLTMAKHPSENESRMMYRLLSFLYCAHEDLEFSKGLSTTEEPELWQKGYSGEIIQWIELGLPEIKRLKQACGRSQSVTVFTYHKNKTYEWFKKIQKEFPDHKKLRIYHFNVTENGPLEKLVAKSMKLSCVIEDQMMYIGDDIERIGIDIEKGEL
ncbi:MAG: YaeQ family protein [Bacteriovoracaceae bacterium]|jgi:uncharacterized protein YaeQ|nr:YaeQ family protein [Bacteriovoracaceae bacterium]